MTLFKPYLLAFAALLLCACAPVQSRQWGGASDEVAQAVEVLESQGLTLVAYQRDKGDPAFVLAFDQAGKAVWGYALPGIFVFDIAVNRALGVVYAVGSTQGLANNYLTRLSFDGTFLGTTTWTNAGPLGVDSVRAVDVGANGNVYVAGELNFGQPYLKRFDAQGRALNQTWWPTETVVQDLAIDIHGGVYVVGYGTAFEYGVLAKFTAEANLSTVTRFEPKNTLGNRFDVSLSGVAVDNTGTAFAVGTLFDRDTADYDGVLAVFGPNGAAPFIGRRNFGTGGKHEYPEAVVLDATGTLHVAGHFHLGGSDFFVSRVTRTTDLVGTTVWGTAEYDAATDATVDSLGRTYVTGRTDGDLASPNAGGIDAVLSVVSH